MPAVRALQEKSFVLSPPGEPVVRQLTPKADTIQSFGIDLRAVLSDGGHRPRLGGAEGRRAARAHAAGQGPQGRARPSSRSRTSGSP